jgi:hypothetical protein
LRAQKVNGEIMNVPVDTIEHVRDPDSKET